MEPYFCKDSIESISFGFTLIELLIVIAIIGILAAVALPFYRGYVIRAQLTEVEHTIAVVGSAVTQYRMDQNAWPNYLTFNEVATSLGVKDPWNLGG